jgi:hypothetical protein
MVMSEVLCLNEKCGDERLNAKTGGCCALKFFRICCSWRGRKKRKIFPATMRAISAVNALSLSLSLSHTHEHTSSNEKFS